MSRRFALASLAAMLLLWLPPRAHAATTPSAIPDEVTHLRDPFKKPNAGPKTAPRSPLELYSVDKFRLLAVMTGPRRLRAMVEAPNGKSYLVWENMHIGLRKGIVRRITPDAIHVREQVVNVLGQEESVDSEIRMSETLEASGSSSSTTGNTLTDQPSGTSGKAGAAPPASDSGAAPSADAGTSISVAPAPESAPVPAVAAPTPEAAPAPVVPASPDAKPAAGSASGTGTGTGTGTAAPGSPSGG